VTSYHSPSARPTPARFPRPHLEARPADLRIVREGRVRASLRKSRALAAVADLDLADLSVHTVYPVRGSPAAVQALCPLSTAPYADLLPARWQAQVDLERLRPKT